jgi:hypothetical protein
MARRKGGGGGATNMIARPTAGANLPAYFYRLSGRAQRIYLSSDAVERFELVPSPGALRILAALMNALESEDVARIGPHARALVAEICRLLGVPAVPVEVRGVRPHNQRGELHGLFYPFDRVRRTPAHIILWMRTAQRHDVVKPRTFLRTLMHEVGHYLDYALLRLGDSFHTAGFFKRESSLVRALLEPPPGQHQLTLDSVRSNPDR